MTDEELSITSDKRTIDILKASAYAINYLQFLSDYLTKIRTTNIMEWTNKELKRRNKVVGYSIA